MIAPPPATTHRATGNRTNGSKLRTAEKGLESSEARGSDPDDIAYWKPRVEFMRWVCATYGRTPRMDVSKLRREEVPEEHHRYCRENTND